MLQITATIAPVFLIIFLGFALARTGLADQRWTEVLNRFGLYIGFPSLILHSLLQLNTIDELPVVLLAVNAGVLLVAVAATWLVCRLLRFPGPLRATYAICVFFGNVAYLGFPVVTALLPGTEAFASANAAVYLAVMFTAGIALLEYERGGQSRPAEMAAAMLKNPLLLAVLVGVAGVVFGVRLPAILARPLSMLSATASPVVLIALGVFIARHSLSSGARSHVLAVGALKLFLLPLLFVPLFALLPDHGGLRLLVLQAAMPVGLTPFALAELYPLDREIISSAIVITTLLSALTLALTAGLLGL